MICLRMSEAVIAHPTIQELSFAVRRAEILREARPQRSKVGRPLVTVHIIFS